MKLQKKNYTTKQQKAQSQKQQNLKMIGQDTRFKKILNILPQTKKLRNVSIVAHVDHGKTTIADCLISSNGIIHKKQAGQLRLLDDRLDEQDRGITMKSSSISLVYQDFLINLIDSPGHLEFYSEVSSALRLTDAALLVVDVVEGVSSQTFRVLRELYEQKLPSILVLNKIDKLILHCKMDPMQAYNQINQIIEQVNAVLGSFISKQLVSQNRKRTQSEDIEDTKQFQSLQNMFYFSAQKRNIVFGSALNNWGFTPECFATLIAKKIGTQSEKIVKYMWGDYYFNPKTKEFSQKPRNQNDRPVCVDWILKPIWDIFENVQSQNKEKIQKVIAALGLKIAENTKKTYNHLLIRQILNAWLPFDVILLKRMTQSLPDPIIAQNFRLSYLLNTQSEQTQIVPQNIRLALSSCSNTQDAPLIAFVSKMVNINVKNFNQRGLNELQSNEKQTTNRTLGFARIFSGKLRRGDELMVISARKKKIVDEITGKITQIPDIQKVRINNLYVFNGQYPDGIVQAYAGNIVGIGNLEDVIFKSGTISSTDECISFIPVNKQSKSVLKVSISTPNIEDNNKLLDGLKKLNKSDPSVQVYIQSTGDIILNTCGQVHLQKCIVDLEQIYCKIPIVTSDPIISFRQTITWTSLNELKNEKYLSELEKKRKEKEKKILQQKFKEERVTDKELDQEEKQKINAIKDWETGVQIYQSQDLTVEDTRYFIKNRDDQGSQKYSYKQQKQLKKIDHKNRGKMHKKQKFMNLNFKTNFSKQLTPNQLIYLKIKAIGIPFQVAQYLQKQSDRMKRIFSNEQKQNGIYKEKFQNERKLFVKSFFQEKLKEFSVDQNVVELLKQKMVCFGPNQYGPNFLVFDQIVPQKSLYYRAMHPQLQKNQGEMLIINQGIQKIIQDYKLTVIELQNSIKLGFDLACNSGPLCGQPLAGVIFIIEDITLSGSDPLGIFSKQVLQKQAKNQQKSQEQAIVKQGFEQKQQTVALQAKPFNDPFGSLSGQVMSSVKDTCLQAFIGGSPRLVEPMYLCELQTDQQYYGSVYNQLSKRRAVIISQDLHQISNVFIIKAYLPVVQSQRFCYKLQDNSKGTINAQLRLDTWKIFNEDPFYVPLTEEEIQQNGLDNITFNHARNLLEKIRAKKGMNTNDKIVVAAEKQRTLKKK